MKKYILNVFFLFFVFIANSQETGRILGTVIDEETGNAISNAEILVLETDRGTVTSNKGIFELNEIKTEIKKQITRIREDGRKLLNMVTVQYFDYLMRLSTPMITNQ